MAKIRIIIKHEGSSQVGENDWVHWSGAQTYDIEDEALAEILGHDFAKIIGFELIGAAPTSAALPPTKEE